MNIKDKQMDKQYINNPYAPELGLSFKQQIEIIYTLVNTTVEPVLSGHTWGMVKWPLIIGWPSNKGCKKNNSNAISAEKTFDPNKCFNKQGNHLLYLMCYIIWNVYQQVTDTVWPFNTCQGKTIIGTSKMVTMTT